MNWSRKWRGLRQKHLCRRGLLAPASLQNIPQPRPPSPEPRAVPRDDLEVTIRLAGEVFADAGRFFGKRLVFGYAGNGDVAGGGAGRQGEGGEDDNVLHASHSYVSAAIRMAGNIAANSLGNG